MKLFASFLNIFNASAQVPSASESQSELIFEPIRFIEMFEYMGKGMLVIFIIIGVIILTTMLINKGFSSKK